MSLFLEGQKRLCLFAFHCADFRAKDKLLATSKILLTCHKSPNMLTPRRQVLSADVIEPGSNSGHKMNRHYTECACMGSILTKVENLFPARFHSFSSSGFPTNLEIIFQFISNRWLIPISAEWNDYGTLQIRAGYTVTLHNQSKRTLYIVSTPQQIVPCLPLVLRNFEVNAGTVTSLY